MTVSEGEDSTPGPFCQFRVKQSLSDYLATPEQKLLIGQKSGMPHVPDKEAIHMGSVRGELENCEKLGEGGMEGEWNKG